MAENAAIPDINTFLAERRANIINKLFEGVTTGADLTDFNELRQTLARIPEFDDEGDDRWWWEDNIDTDLRTEPEDINDDEIKNIRSVLDTVLENSADTPERTEISAHLYLLSLDRNFELPDGTTAKEFLEDNPALSLKGDLRWLASPGPGGEESIFGRDFSAYDIDPTKLTDPTSADFIETFGAALAIIQSDMRNLGTTPPVGAHAFLDPAILASAEATPYHNQVVEALITRLGDNEVLQEIKELTGTERLEALAFYVNDLDDANPDKAALQANLEILKSPASPIQFVELAVEYGVLPPADLLRARLFDIGEIGADKTGMFGENTQALLGNYLDYAEGSAVFERVHPELRTRAIYFSRINDIYEDLPQDQKDAIDAALEARAGDAPGVHIPLSPEEAEELATREAEREATRGQLDVLEAAGTAMGIPAEIIAQANPRVLSGVPYAHFDEAFERQMREVFSENWLDAYGIKMPASDNPSVRIGGDEELWRYRYPEPICADFIDTYFETHAENMVVQNIAGRTADPLERFDLLKEAVSHLDENDRLARGFAELQKDINANSFEYHIQPDTGDITKYRVAANGVDLYTNVATGNDTPLVLEGEFPDFDIFHPNFVTRDLLTSITQRMWLELKEEENGLDQLFTRQPNHRELGQATQILETRLKDAIKSLQPDLDDEGINELYSELQTALNNPEQFYRMKLARDNPGMDEDMQESRLDALMYNYNKIDMMQEVLRAREGSRNTVEQINTYLIQIGSMQKLGEMTAMRDYANLMVDGLLPDGSTTARPRVEAPWGQDFSGMYRDNGSFSWESATEFRSLTPELYAAYDSALNRGGTVSADLFDYDDYAKAYIEAQGWGESLDYVQSSMVARAMMIKEAADRHGVDPNSPEARAAFMEDYQDGYYNKIDIDIMMRSFDADGPNRASHRERLAQGAWREGTFDEPADQDNRMELFNEMFKQPVELPGGVNPDGSPMIAESTITIEDAMAIFWRANGKYGNLTDPRTGQVYDEEKYGLDYATMLERHPEEFPGIIKTIMEGNNFYQINLLRDVNDPEGDFYSREVRRYQATYQQRLELQYKEDNNVISPAPEANAGATPNLDPAIDTITPMPEPVEEPAPSEMQPEADNDNAAELRENCTEMTELTPECAAAIGQGGGIAPSLPFQPAQGSVLGTP